MEKSEQINELAKALCKARLEIEPILKNTKGYNYSYAQLDQVLEKVIPAFSQHDLSIAQFPIQKDGIVGVETIIMHSSGQYLQSEFATKPMKSDCQSIGSQLTYYRRYSLLAICGIAPEDDDGVRALPVNHKNNPQNQNSSIAINQVMTKIADLSKTMDKEELQKLFKEASGVEKTDQLKTMSIEKLQQIFKRLELL